MTVKQLIAALKKMPPDADVYRWDCEYGYMPIAAPRDVAKIYPTVNRPSQHVERPEGGYRARYLRKGVIL